MALGDRMRVWSVSSSRRSIVGGGHRQVVRRRMAQRRRGRHGTVHRSMVFWMSVLSGTRRTVAVAAHSVRHGSMIRSSIMATTSALGMRSAVLAVARRGLRRGCWSMYVM